MRGAITKTLEMLADMETGWVNRRDAAIDLGVVAVEAVQGLKAHQDDSDSDVQQSVLEALRDAAKALEGIDVSGASSGVPSLEKLVEAMQKKGSRDVSKSGDAYDVTVSTTDGRSQIVHVEATQSNTKRDVVRVTTKCAKSNKKMYEWALKNNESMSHCSLALELIDGKPWLILVNNLLADTVTYAELKLTVKEVAYYGDWVEEKLTGGDEN